MPIQRIFKLASCLLARRMPDASKPGLGISQFVRLKFRRLGLFFADVSNQVELARDKNPSDPACRGIQTIPIAYVRSRELAPGVEKPARESSTQSFNPA